MLATRGSLGASCACSSPVRVCLKRALHRGRLRTLVKAIMLPTRHLVSYARRLKHLITIEAIVCAQPSAHRFVVTVTTVNTSLRSGVRKVEHILWP